MDSWSSTGLQINRVLYQVMAIWMLSVVSEYFLSFCSELFWSSYLMAFRHQILEGALHQFIAKEMFRWKQQYVKYL
ncbi:uncharacterized protein LOC142179438 isoform X4 [Nicotiana tabacum]|uniref:Uncharacterized protein LOC142179438 isoform X4 n=1 Tax=Nicotiana tabacum TaxID=4097 RepID=A0AC58U7V0_TOBAC